MNKRHKRIFINSYDEKEFYILYCAAMYALKRSSSAWGVVSEFLQKNWLALDKDSRTILRNLVEERKGDLAMYQPVVETELDVLLINVGKLEEIERQRLTKGMRVDHKSIMKEAKL